MLIIYIIKSRGMLSNHL